MAALHDGNSFLAAKYALALTPALTLLDPNSLGHPAKRALLGGLSVEVPNFGPLEAVPEELASVEEIYSGKVLLNEDFPLTRIDEEMDRTNPVIVHIASHAVFTGDPDTSYLVTYDGRVGMGQLSDVVGMTRFSDQPLELIVLSACQTAEGNNRAALGLAGSAIRAGARSAVGSLWSISDRGTYELIWAPFLLINNWLYVATRSRVLARGSKRTCGGCWQGLPRSAQHAPQLSPSRHRARLRRRGVLGLENPEVGSGAYPEILDHCSSEGRAVDGPGARLERNGEHPLRGIG